MLKLKQIAKLLLRKLLIIFILMTAVIGLLISTNPGLVLLFKVAGYCVPGTLEVENIHGSLLSKISFDRLSYHDKTMNLSLRNASLSWSITALLHHQLLVKSITADEIQFETRTTEGESKKTTPLRFPHLPFELLLQQVSIAKIKYIHGASNHQFGHFSLQAQLNNQQWLVNRLVFDYQSIHLASEINAEPVFPHQLHASFKFNNPSGKKPLLKGNLNVSGDFFLYHWQGQLMQPGSLTFNGIIKNGKEVHSQLQWQNLNAPIGGVKLASENGHLNIDGLFPDLKMTFEAQTSSPLKSTIAAQLDSNAQGFNGDGTIDFPEGHLDFHSNYNGSASPSLIGSVKAQAGSLGAPPNQLKQFKWSSQFFGNTLEDIEFVGQFSGDWSGNELLTDMNYRNQQLNVRAELAENKLEIFGKFPHQWQIKAAIPKPKFLHPELAGLDTNINLDASLQNPQAGTMNLSISPGSYQLSQDEKSRKLEFHGGKLNAVLSSKSLKLLGNITIDDSKQLDLNLILEHFKLNESIPDKQKIQGNLRLTVNSLNFLQNLSPDISKPQGRLQAQLKAKGTLAKPNIEGNLSLKEGRVSLPNFGLDLNSIEFELTSRNKRWQGNGLIRSNSQALTIKGQGVYDKGLAGTFNLDGDSFNLINTKEYSIAISPKLLVEFSPDSLSLKGQVLVPKAEIKPQSFSNSATLSEDVVFSEAKKPDNPWHMSTDVQVGMGENVAISIKGLTGRLIGAVHLSQLPNEPLNANGELSIQDGKYKAYGQDLTVEEGQLLFTGPMLTNPGLRVKAVRKFKNNAANFPGSGQLFDFNPSNLDTLNLSNNVTVGIAVTGRVNSPKIELFSTPGNLSQADILSMLLLGRPANQANKAGGQLLLAAISSMNLNQGTEGTQLMEQLKQALGVDVNLESTSQYDKKTNQLTDRTSVVVGKSISKRLYLSYNFGLAQTDSNVVTLTYLLNKFFSIQVNSSVAGSGIDLLYTHRKE
nr:DUF490 domain-containing protein [Legionella jordanis]